MNGQPASLVAYKLKKLMAQAADGIDVSEAVRSLLECERHLRAEQSARIDEQLRNVLQMQRQTN